MEKLKNTFAGFWKYRYLLQNLISRDFKLKYRRSVLGADKSEASGLRKTSE